MSIEYFSLSKKSFFNKYGLGDLISIAYCLENLGNQKNILFKIKTDADFEKIYTTIFSYFNFKNIKFSTETNRDIDIIEKIRNFSKNKKCKCKNGLFNGCFFICCLSKFLIEKYKFDPNKSNPIETPNKFDKKLILIQFDKKSNHLKNTKYSEAEIKSLLKNKSDYYCIGGKDTTNYLKNANYMLGDLSFIIDKMTKCKEFIGIDSGMSHLAGMLGIDSTIYLKNDLGCIYEYYSNSYKNCKILNKNFRIF